MSFSPVQRDRAGLGRRGARPAGGRRWPAGPRPQRPAARAWPSRPRAAPGRCARSPYRRSIGRRNSSRSAPPAPFSAASSCGRGPYPPHKCPLKRTLIGTTGRWLPSTVGSKLERAADDQRERRRGRPLTLPGRRAATLIIASAPADERSQRPFPESAFPQVKEVRVVRDRIELSTFRFSAGLSLAETTFQKSPESSAHTRSRCSVD